MADPSGAPQKSLHGPLCLSTSPRPQFAAVLLFGLCPTGPEGSQRDTRGSRRDCPLADTPVFIAGTGNVSLPEAPEALAAAREDQGAGGGRKHLPGAGRRAGSCPARAHAGLAGRPGCLAVKERSTTSVSVANTLPRTASPRGLQAQPPRGLLREEAEAGAGHPHSGSGAKSTALGSGEKGPHSQWARGRLGKERRVGLPPRASLTNTSRSLPPRSSCSNLTRKESELQGRGEKSGPLGAQELRPTSTGLL